MKNLKLLLFFTLLTISGVQAQIVNIPDPNFKLALLDHLGEPIDINNDGEIQVTEAEAITELIVGDGFINNNIVDLTGIEAFINITLFHCFNNYIEMIDLSNNLNLIILDCGHNQISSLNISQNILLEELRCAYNELTILDLTQNIVLIELFCNDNQLTELDVSENNSLEIFTCSNNLLTHLDIRNDNYLNITGFSSNNNPNLICIFVDNSSYRDNTWSDNIDPNSTFVETQGQCDALSIEYEILSQIEIFPNPIKN